jgi:peroxiredoxin Q/BCP
MTLSLYSKAPDFVLPDMEGKEIRLSTFLAQGPVVLFFYPKAFTAGCTEEVCSFRDQYTFFQQRGIQILGVSHDTKDALKSYADKYRLPFPLLSDPTRRVCKLYKAVYPFGFLTRRVSYYIGREGLILGAYDNLLNGAGHISQMEQRILHLENLETPQIPG